MEVNMALQKYFTYLFISCLFLLPIHSLFSKTIIWDLGYVLFKPNTMKAGSYVGMGDALAYILGGGDSDTLKNKAFAILSQIKGDQECPEHEIVRANDGKALPLIMCDWQAGVQTPEEILKQALAQIEKPENKCFFKNKREKQLVINTLKLMFEPSIIADIMHPIKKGIKLLEECKKNGHTQMVLSNFDAQSCALLFKTAHGKKVFKFFEPCNVVLSGAFEHHNYLKPHKTFFEYLLNEYNLDPSECIFIDDQEENINAARACGITAIHLKNKNYNAVRKQLCKLGVLA